MSTHNIGFYEDLTKIIFELSSNTHLISSAACTSIRHKIYCKATLFTNIAVNNLAAINFCEYQ